ncbi:MAG: glycosyl transferase family 4 [Halioglobus sp.]|nr:glycosyl transferase family 4 [Halioglobus sp.]
MNLAELALMVGATALLSVLFCRLYLRFALRRQILDEPNARSSHRVATPHGGGMPLLLAFYTGLLLSVLSGANWQAVYLWLAALSLVLMIIGVVDDLRGLAVLARLAAYTLLCGLAVALVLADAPWPLLSPAGSALALAAALGMLWLLNLYNFMDGIDGIAGLQAALALGGAALLSWWSSADAAYVQFCLLLAAAQLGFLWFNWPPARLFMGDAGSVPTGFLLGGLALAGAIGGQLSLACWLILLACFITDASLTLAWRVFTGQRFTEAHRQHAYQRLSRHWGSHRAVDRLLLLIFAVWLLPLAVATVIWPSAAGFLVIVTYLPLLFGMAKTASLQ